jgi:gliotoxin/aspirochlorine biosynthesis thioredoxin reductase
MPSALLNREPNNNDYDVIIVGGSHAGLSAALTLYRALHRCVIFDSSKPRDTSGAPVHLASGWDGANAEKLKEVQVSELKSTGLIDFVSRAVVSAKKLSDGTFEVTDDSNVLWKGKKILLAIGMQEVYPKIPGYAENYGSTMSENAFACCQTCTDNS